MNGLCCQSEHKCFSGIKCRLRLILPMFCGKALGICCGGWWGSDPGQTPSLLSPPQLQATWKQLVRCRLRCSQFWCLLEMVYFSWIPWQVGAQAWVGCSEWNELQMAPYIPRRVVNRRAVAIEGRVCVILTSHSYLHQWEEMVHGNSRRVLQPALVNDVQTLLLCFFLAGIANVPQAVP